MKKKLLFLVAALALFVPTAMAADVTDADGLESCLLAGGTCTLQNDIEVNKIITVDKAVELNLNGNDVAFTLKNHILLKGGNLNITGEGTMYEKNPYYAPIYVKGSDNVSDTNYSTLTVGKDVTLKGWSGIFISYISEDSKKAYGITVNLNGTAIGVKDSDGTCEGAIYINGNITDSNNAPVINISSTAKIESEGQGIYAAGYGVWTIEDGASIEGTSGIEIRAGILNVKGGTITGTNKALKGTSIELTATDGTITSRPNGNGPTTVGAGIAVVQHTTKLPITVNILGGTIKGVEAIYANDTQGNGAEAWSKVKVAVTGGTFSTDVVDYLTSKYVAKLVDGSYVVSENKVIETSDEKVAFESEEALDNNLRLDVASKAEEEVTKVTEKVEEAYKENKEVKDTTLIALYDINVMDGREVVPMENGNFTISIALDEEETKYDNYKVIYIDDEGNIAETLDAKLVDGKVVFETTHLSVYGIVGYNNVTQVIDNPNTGDNLSMIIILGGLSLILLSGAALKLKKSN